MQSQQTTFKELEIFGFTTIFPQIILAGIYMGLFVIGEGGNVFLDMVGLLLFIFRFGDSMEIEKRNAKALAFFRKWKERVTENVFFRLHLFALNKN